MPSFERVAAVSDMPPGAMRRVSVQGREVLLVNQDGSFHALSPDCTHAGGALEDGTLTAGEVTCPIHGGVFSLTTGEPLGGPPDAPLSCYTVTVSGDDLLVDVGTASA